MLLCLLRSLEEHPGEAQDRAIWKAPWRRWQPGCVLSHETRGHGEAGVRQIGVGRALQLSPLGASHLREVTRI